MPTIIMDQCIYTCSGLASYLIAKGIDSKNVNSENCIRRMPSLCEQMSPGVVFINDPEVSQRIR